MSPRHEDLTGQRFGTRTAIERRWMTHTKRHRKRGWLAICDCGHESVVTKHNLKNSKSCHACSVRNRGPQGPTKDLTGKVFGSRVVVGLKGKVKNHYHWIIRCACGREDVRSYSSIVNSKNCVDCTKRRNNKKGLEVGTTILNIEEVLRVAENRRPVSKKGLLVTIADFHDGTGRNDQVLTVKSTNVGRAWERFKAAMKTLGINVKAGKKADRDTVMKLPCAWVDVHRAREIINKIFEEREAA